MPTGQCPKDRFGHPIPLPILVLTCCICGAKFKHKRRYKLCSRVCMAKYMKLNHNSGMFKVGQRANEKHPNWKGDKVGYWALHAWIARNYGKPSKCEKCGTEMAKKYEWANKSGKYLRDIKDWLRLCCSCHHHYDDVFEKMMITRGLRGLPNARGTGVEYKCKVCGVTCKDCYSKSSLCKKHYIQQWHKKRREANRVAVH